MLLLLPKIDIGSVIEAHSFSLLFDQFKQLKAAFSPKYSLLYDGIITNEG